MSIKKNSRRNKKCHWCGTKGPLQWYGGFGVNNRLKLCADCINKWREENKARGEWKGAMG